jgi:hypothetical protein
MSKNNISEHAKALSIIGAQKGGKARAARLSQEERKKIARKAAEARWEKENEQSGTIDILKAKRYTGILDLGGYNISCAVLDNGQRILVERSMANALGTKGSGAYWQRKRASIHAQKGAFLPEYISARYLRPFVSKELRVKLENPISYINKNGRLTIGVDATVLPDICDVWITAREKGALNKDQEKTAERAYILMKAFATVGIIALIDEATGYQEERDRLALQEILDKYLLSYKAAWAKRFPDSFYKAMFKLKGWNYDPKSVKRPSIIGTMTNDIVYSRLAPGILEELQARTPKDDKGRRMFRYHQLLTEDVGHPKLQEHLIKAEVLMNAAPNYPAFHRMLQRALPKEGETFPMDIPEE